MPEDDYRNSVNKITVENDSLVAEYMPSFLTPVKSNVMDYAIMMA